MLTVNNHLGTTSATRCITVEGFKSIERVEEMPLNPINILIGPNGAGKTNLSFRRIGPDRLPSSFWKSRVGLASIRHHPRLLALL